MQTTIPLTRDLVLIGGGHSHALVLRMWGMNPLPGVRITIISPAPTASYSGMLPGFVAGHYTKDQLDIDLVKLARFAGARVILAKATGLDLKNRKVLVEGRSPVSFDVASVDVGITTEMPDLSGFAEHGTPAKPLDTFAAKWHAYRKESLEPRVAVLGGGIAGAELAMAMAHALKRKKAVVTLIDRGEIVSEFNDTARSLIAKSLEENGVRVLENTTVSSVAEKAVLLTDGTEVKAEFVVGAAGPKPHGWVSSTGLNTYSGYITVGPTLQSSDPQVFAAGDCAHLSHDPRPKAGVYAVREAPVLYHNLRAMLSGGTLKGYTPQKDYLKLVSLGGQSAMAEKFGTARRGGLLWKWKDTIDRSFMEKFHELPEMPQEKLPSLVADGVKDAIGDAPMCGGCGSKVGRSALTDALRHLSDIDRDDVRSVRGDDAAVIEVGGKRQVISTDHLRQFVEDPYLMTRIAANHALGDVWAMGARPQVATMSVILPRMSPELQERTMAEIVEAASEEIERSGAVIVGGHSSVGSELTVGFTVTGLCEQSEVTLSGAQVGDKLILTKAIGTGVLMAAEMRGLARGGDVVAALSAMLEPQSAASTVLAPEAHAMTDVTGFGLAGHLQGICEAVNLGAEIELDAIPLLEGAEELAEKGVKSTLWQENRDGAGPVFGTHNARFDLLFDPQTAGGLLAAVPASKVEEIQKQLLMCGHKAAVIGTITETPAIKVT